MLPRPTAARILAELYDSHAEWCATLPLACQKGCGSCCTQSVTITGLEGLEIISYFTEQNRLPELDSILAQQKTGAQKPPLTTNEFAEYCLQGITPEEPVHEEWDFSPCPFLREQNCSIYPARPFSCRAFISMVHCISTGSAEVTPLALTVNTVFTQLIEHLSQGYQWGKMLDILSSYRSTTAPPEENGPESPLRDAKPLPGLMVCKGEQNAIHALLGPLLAKSVKSEQVGDLLKLDGVI